jgi:hypothetical protein
MIPKHPNVCQMQIKYVKMNKNLIPAIVMSAYGDGNIFDVTRRNLSVDTLSLVIWFHISRVMRLISTLLGEWGCGRTGISALQRDIAWEHTPGKSSCNVQLNSSGPFHVDIFYRTTYLFRKMAKHASLTLECKHWPVQLLQSHRHGFIDLLMRLISQFSAWKRMSTASRARYLSWVASPCHFAKLMSARSRCITVAYHSSQIQLPMSKASNA